MAQLGTEALPIRVAIIGSGPSGFYAADYLLKRPNLVIYVDMFDRLPTPFGLVRGGVAPDHASIKSVTRVYSKTAEDPKFRFYGYVEFGKDISHDEMRARYHAIIYAVGAQTDRRMGIPGEDLAGSHAATEFVGWYNAHPDYRGCQFDLTQKAVAVIGNGNVAMDVIRILASSYEELRATDIADYALEALRASAVEDIYVLGRRGPAQASFTNPELKELGDLSDADVIVSPEDATPDALSQEWLTKEPNPVVTKNIQTLLDFSKRIAKDRPKRIHLRFLVSPIELIGKGQVEAIKIVKNILQPASDGSLRPKATDQSETIPVGLVFRSIGYMGIPLPGVVFDEKAGVIPNQGGRVIDPKTQAPIVGEYAVGWIKRGPSGLIGNNKPDSQATVDLLLEDVSKFAELDPAIANREAMEALIRQRKPEFVSFEDWKILDRLESENGQHQGRPRIKFSDIPTMLAELKRAKGQ